MMAVAVCGPIPRTLSSLLCAINLLVKALKVRIGFVDDLPVGMMNPNSDKMARIRFISAVRSLT